MLSHRSESARCHSSHVPRFALNPEMLRRWPALLEIVLVLVLVVQGLRLVLMLFAPGEQAVRVTIPSLPDPVPSLAGHEPFFGQQPVAPSQAGGWRLFGLRLDSTGGSAILGRDNGPQASYRAGDELATGVVLAKVASDHVQLREGGALRRVELPSQAPTAGVTAPPAGQLPSALPTAAPTGATPTVDPSRLLEQTGLQARNEAGRVTGYALMPGGNEALLRLAGLQPGDVLLSINGQALDPEHLPEVQAQLKNESRAVVSFQRDGQTHTVTLGSGNP